MEKHTEEQEVLASTTNQDKDQDSNQQDTDANANVDFKDLYLRLLAEVKNQATRHRKEIVTTRDYAVSTFIAELVVVLDNLEFALQHDKGNVSEGIQLTYDGFMKLLNKHQVHQINPEVNSPFDYRYHESVGTDSTEGVEENFILNVIQKGYLFKDRVIRSAKVIVNIKNNEQK